MKKSAAAYTLGCKVNQCDTENLLTNLRNIGLGIRDFNETADVYIINTCTVTHVSDKKCRQMIRKAKKQNPKALIAVCGCMVRNKNAAMPKDIDFIFDARKPDNFLEFLIKNLSTDLSTDLSINENNYTLSKTRAFIKIQDGCNNFCSYCIVPYVRGALNSRPIMDIVTEGQNAVQNGALEIVLTGIQAASYGDDIETSLSLLIQNTATINGLKRLRLSSIDPRAVNGEFLKTVKNTKILCDHFHLSLQSGCNKILEQMNRRYTTEIYQKAVNSLRKLRPNCAITTDIIVGFPGETDSDFNETLEFVKKIAFAQVHVFEFSPREGTAAADFVPRVSQAIKSERGAVMRKLAAQLQTKFLESQIGKKSEVLFESNSKGYTTNYCRVKSKTSNTLKCVEIIGLKETYLLCKEEIFQKPKS